MTKRDAAAVTCYLMDLWQREFPETVFEAWVELFRRIQLPPEMVRDELREYAYQHRFIPVYAEIRELFDRHIRAGDGEVAWESVERSLRMCRSEHRPGEFALVMSWSAADWSDERVALAVEACGGPETLIACGPVERRMFLAAYKRLSGNSRAIADRNVDEGVAADD